MKKYIMYGILLIAITIVLGLFIKYNPFEKEQELGVRDEMAILHIAERNNVPIESLIPLLPPEKRTNPVTTLMNLHVPIKDLGLDKEKIKSAIRTAQAGGFPMTDVLRYILWSIWLFAAGFILFKSKNIRKIRIVWLLITLIVFGIILGAEPNPMEALVRIHKLFLAIPGNPLAFVIVNFIIFTILSIFGAKMLCSWGCQLGALQESIYNIPIFKKLKRIWKLPFAASITARITLYLTFFILFFKILDINQGGLGGIFYHHFNMFKIYDFYDLAMFTLLLIPIVLTAGLVIFRPFCQLICPFGLYSWLLENIAVYKVRKIHTDACTSCSICEDVCPTDAMKAMNKNTRKYFLPDCWSCGKCIDVCPNNALKFTSQKLNKRANKITGTPERDDREE
jgi:NAD-dependent dihydropyrimidine dehydrogenase PreA subunit